MATMQGLILLVVIVAAAAALVSTASGASYTVGAPAGSWDLRTNYTAWASSTKLQTGDQLRFQYPVGVHNVVEVGKAGYDACNSSSPVATFSTGDDVVPLPAVGTRYFICGVAGHCAAGMKLQVDVKSQPPMRCRGRGSRRRCSRADTPTSSAAAGAESVQAALVLSAAAVAAHALVMLFFYY